MAVGMKNEQMDPEKPVRGLGDYVEESLEEHVGGAGRFQYLYLFLLGLPWSYSAMLFTISIFAGENGVAKEAAKTINCTTATRPFISELPSELHMPVSASYVTEFDLFCSREKLSPFLSTLYFFGFMLGVPLFGALSDRFGRRIAYLIPLVLVQIAAMLSAFAPSYATYAATKVVAGFGVAGFGLVAYVWCAEFLGSELRPAMTWAPNVLWSLGQSLLSPLAFRLRPWRYLSFAVGLFGLGFFAYFPVLLESPKWLASKGRGEEAHEVLRRVARRNGRRNPPPPDVKPLLPEDAREADQGGSLLQLLDRRLIGRFLVMCLNWFTTSMGYFGLTLNATSLPLSAYWANVVGAGVAIPAYYVASIMVECPACGRRGAVCLGFLVCGGCLLLSMFGDEIWLMVMYYTAMSAISMVFAVIYVYATELFPTDIRGSSMGLQSLCARIGAMVAPFVGHLGDRNLTLFIFATPCAVAGLATLLLPETRGKPLPGTIDELDGGISEGETTDSTSEYDNE